MGSLFGSTTNPTPSNPTVGHDTQTNFFNSLFGLGLTPNPDGSGMMFNSMPAYGGQLTPDLSKMMSSNVWNAWQPQAPGMGQTQGITQGIQGGIGQMSPYMQSIIGGPSGPGTQALNGYMNGNVANNPLAAYMQGQQVSYPIPKQVQAPPGVHGGLAQIIGGKPPKQGGGQ